MATIKRIGNTGLRLFCDCDQFVHEITVNGKNVEVFSSKVGKGKKKEDEVEKKKATREKRDPFVDFITGRGKEEREGPDEGDDEEGDDGSDTDEDK